MVFLKQVGTEYCERDRLQISVSTSASSAEQTLSARPGMLSGPAAFRGFVLLSALHTSADVTVSEELCAASVGRIPLLVLRSSKRA